MFRSMTRKTGVVLIAAALLAGCGDPATNASSAFESAHKAWQKEAGDFNPADRLENYDRIISGVENIAKRYPQTPTGRAIAAGESIDGLSLAEMKQARESLAPRVQCYANPTIACLLPFSSHATGSGSTGGTLADAQQRICSQGFPAAETVLEPVKINQPVYTHDLVQVAMSAAGCNRPADTNSAVKAYLAALPATDRSQAMLSILATDLLKPAWPGVIQTLATQAQTPGLPRDEAGSIATALAMAYAKTGNAKAALAQYQTLTTTLGYQLDYSTKKDFGQQLILHGAAAEGLPFVDDYHNPFVQMAALTRAAGTLKGRLYEGASTFPRDKQILGTPVPATERASTVAVVDSIEAELDKLAPQLKQDAVSDGNGIDLAYGMLALVRQQAGQAGKATATMQKGVAIRTRLLGSSTAQPNLADFSKLQATLALLQDRPDDAARFAATTPNSGDDLEPAILTQLARKGEVQQALSLVSGVYANDWNGYGDLVGALAQLGKTAQAEQVIAAVPDPRRQASLYSTLLQGIAASGDVDAAEAYAKKHNLLNTTGEQLRLYYALVQSKKIGGNRDEAEPLLRKMFAIAQGIDKDASGQVGRWNQYTAQGVAGQAFALGFTDLGAELYQAAENRNAKPFEDAFTDGIKPRDMTTLLMLAQANLDGQQLQFVIDTAIAHLQKTQAAQS